MIDLWLDRAKMRRWSREKSRMSGMIRIRRKHLIVHSAFSGLDAFPSKECGVVWQMLIP